MLEGCGEGVLGLDAAGIINYANPSACRILSRPAPELLGRNAETLLCRQPAGDAQRAAAPAPTRSLLGGAPGSRGLATWVQNEDGRIVPIECRVSPLSFDGRSSGYVVSFHDISERIETEELLMHLAHHDPLTELPNRRLVLDRLDYEICRAKRYRESFALHLIDVDDFKAVNDAYGHPVGDRLLIRLAERFRSALRQSDTVARIGGDEFAVIQVAVDTPEGAAKLARKLLSEARQPLRVDGIELFPSVTIGVGLFSGELCEDSVWRQADAALRQAKGHGKNTFVVVDADTAGALPAAETLRLALAGAVAGQQLRLVYQPQFCLERGAIVGVEATLRWRHPQLGEVAPTAFIPVAEQSRLILPIGVWAVGEICRQAQAWIAAGVPFERIAFKLSPLQLASAGHFAALVDIVDAAGVPWSVLEMEIREQAFSGAGDAVLEQLAMLKGRGLRIAIDDFGSGQSSALAMRRMQADTLRIDPALIRGIHDRVAAGIVRDSVALAHELGMQAVAGDVDLQSQLAMLADFGCDRCQGRQFAGACDAAALEERFFALHGARCDPLAACVAAPAAAVVDDVVSWSESYATGVAQIDFQHRRLVELINRLARRGRVAAAAASSEMNGLLDEIVRFVDYHFQCEEAFMVRHAIVGHHVEHHRAEHAVGRARLGTSIDGYRAGRHGLRELGEDLARWLSGHILAEDKSLGEQLVAISRGSAPHEAYRTTMLASALEAR
ncbi:MAG TPA: EAL domain-containing protein [Azospira sp.]|nr:EAL domain-containing protein [Azospira sp.]